MTDQKLWNWIQAVALIICVCVWALWMTECKPKLTHPKNWQTDAGWYEVKQIDTIKSK